MGFRSCCLSFFGGKGQFFFVVLEACFERKVVFDVADSLAGMAAVF